MVVYLGAIGQDEPLPDVNIMSPNAASLGEYVDFPVNTHSGVPNISIPLYTVTDGSLSLPISLSYHAGGLKLYDLASWVGAGWSLNSGGVVSRTVKGLPDEHIGSRNSGGHDPGSFYEEGGFSSYFLNANGNVDYTGFGVGALDGEPDLFFFNFAGHSGKFYFDERRQPVLLPESDIKIEVLTRTSNPTEWDNFNFKGFKITVTDGTKYYFGETPDANDVDPVEISDVNLWDDNMSLPKQHYSSWYLYKIESADNTSQITLSYENEDYSYYSVSAAPCNPNCDSKINPMKVLINGVRIASIQFSNGEVNFIPSDAPREDLLDYQVNEIPTPNTESKSLQEIQVTSNDLSFCKSFQFDYGYFTSADVIPDYLFNEGSDPSNYDFADDRRLKLNAVQEIDCNTGQSVPSYEFSYYQENAIGRTLSFAQDHWGYYNGVANLVPIPPYSVDNGVSYFQHWSTSADRETKWPAVRAGSLSTIKYPTGGEAEFIYEANQVDVVDISNCDIGSSVFSNTAGMSTNLAETTPPGIISVAATQYYYFEFKVMGNGSGTLDLDGVQVAEVDANKTLVTLYMELTPGDHQVVLHANADEGGGHGVWFEASEMTQTCPPRLVGGLRIKTINQKENGVTEIQKSFEYYNGVLYSIPQYVTKFKNEVFSTGHIGGTQSLNQGGCRKKNPTDNSFEFFTSPVAIHPMTTAQGTHIGYQDVKIIQADGGYTLYEYEGGHELPGEWTTLEDVSIRKIDASVCLETDPVYPSVPKPYDFDRGNLKQVSVYSSSDQLLQQTSYNETYEESPESTNGLTTGHWNATTLPNHYQIKSGRLVSKVETNKIYDPNNVTNYTEVVSTTTFDSDHHAMVTSSSTTNNRGNSATTMTYAPDLTGCKMRNMTCRIAYQAAVDLYTSEYQSDRSACATDVQSVCNTFEKIEDSLSPCMDEWACHMGAWFHYMGKLHEARQTYETCIQGIQSDEEQCITNGFLATDPNVDVLYQMEVNNQIGSPIEIVNYENGEVLGATYFMFDETALDQIYLDKVFKFTTTTPVTDFEDVSLIQEVLSRDARYDANPDLDLRYVNGRIAERKDRSGVVTAYIWGYNNTLPIIKAVGVDYNTLNSAYQSDPINYRDSPTLSGAMISSYEYDPLRGMISETDPNGNKSQYEYDGLGRLLKIKDQDGNVLKEFEYNYRNN